MGFLIARVNLSSSAASHAQRLEALNHDALVEDAQDHPLAIHERQGDDADVHAPPVDGQSKAAVLRHALLGDVHVGHDLDARDNAHSHPALDGGGRIQHSVDAILHARVPLFGVHVYVRGALLNRLGDDRVDQLDDRRVPVCLLEMQILFAVAIGILIDDVFDRLVHAGQPRQQQVQILDRSRRGAHAPAGHHRDVVDRQNVRGIGHRQQQSAVVGEADRNRLIAFGRVGAEEADRAHVEVVDRQVDVVQAEALRHDAGELVVAQHALLDEHETRRAALRASRCHGVLDRVTIGEAEVDDHFADHAGRATRSSWRVQAAAGVLALGLSGRSSGRGFGCWHGDIGHHRSIGTVAAALYRLGAPGTPFSSALLTCASSAFSRCSASASGEPKR